MSMPALFTRRQLPVISGLAGLAAAQAAAAAAIAIATRDIFAAVAGRSAASAGSANHSNTVNTVNTALTTEPVAVAVAVIIAMTLCIALLRIAERSISEYFGQSYASQLREKLFNHLMDMPVRDIAKKRSGSLAIRFIGDLSAVKSWVSTGLSRLISACFVLPGAMLALYWLNPHFALAAVIPLALAILLMAVTAPRLRPVYQSLRNKRARLAADMTERVPVAPELKLLGRKRKEISKLRQSTGNLRSAAVNKTAASASLRALPEISCGIASAAILGSALLSTATVAQTAGALAILGIISLPLRDLAGVWDRYRGWELARQKCHDIFAMPVLRSVPQEFSKSPDHWHKKPPQVALHNIIYGNLNRLCADAEAGESVAIVGPNGAGKSTVLQVIAGLLEPVSGSVKLANQDLCSLQQQKLSQMFSYISLRSPILRGSLRRALTLGLSPRPNDRRILQATQYFGLTSVVNRLGGLDGKVSEQGKNLSAGELRKVQLVRAWLGKPKVLLLDEPDDALDYGSIRLVDKLIRDLNVTTFMVTHNPWLLNSVDTIWYIADGVITEKGPATELLRQKSCTANLFQNEGFHWQKAEQMSSVHGC